MPLVELIDCPYVGKRGERVHLTEAEAGALIALKMARLARAPVVTPRAIKPRKKRAYKRRDMVAEVAPVVVDPVIHPEVEDVTEVEQDSTA